jgi:hypothetical protein
MCITSSAALEVLAFPATLKKWVKHIRNHAIHPAPKRSCHLKKRDMAE